MPLTGTAFGGIPDEGLAFLEDLEERNEREFFQANRMLYRERLLAPFTALLDAAAERLGPLAPDHGPSKVFRIHRDLRFSKDKAPYHTAMRGYVMQRAPLPGVVETGYYVQYSPAGLYTAGGIWHPGRPELERLRAGIADDDRGPDLVELLRARSITLGRQHERAPWLVTVELLDRVVESWRALAALNLWLDETFNGRRPES